jgi:acetoin utilization deacetylase AcuC-like enzyme
MFQVFDERELAHAPATELHNGGWAAHSETAARARAIADALGSLGPARDFGLEPLRAVHSAEYLAFLQEGHEQWRAAGRDGDALGYAWPVVGRRPLHLQRIDARLGRFSYDASTPIAAGTWVGAYWSAQTALTALQPLLGGTERASFALCRPPGHHCGADYLGGYCYLNNAAIAAQAAVEAGRRVAILDLDYHHGNGTQDIFYDRGDVLFVSIHADPSTDYPFFWGHADEVGTGEGAGANLNLPLPRGSGIGPYLRALEQALARVRTHAPDLLLLSFGADTFAGDPISFFQLQLADYPVIGRAVAALGLPTLILMEGGYCVEAIGAATAGFLGGWAE